MLKMIYDALKNLFWGTSDRGTPQDSIDVEEIPSTKDGCLYIGPVERFDSPGSITWITRNTSLTQSEFIEEVEKLERSLPYHMRSFAASILTEDMVKFAYAKYIQPRDMTNKFVKGKRTIKIMGADDPVSMSQFPVSYFQEVFPKRSV